MSAARGVNESFDPERLTGDVSASGVRCAACSTVITRSEDACMRGGAIDHTFTNPVSMTYEIRCFARAEQLLLVGAPTTFYTWFAGYAWQIANCAVCKVHLGWAFTGEESFYGLIRARLLEA